MSDQLTPPTDNTQAIANMWPRLHMVEDNQDRFDAALAALKEDLVQSMRAHGDHLDAQDAKLDSIDVKLARQGMRWPDAAKIIVAAALGALLTIVLHGHL